MRHPDRRLLFAARSVEFDKRSFQRNKFLSSNLNLDLSEDENSHEEISQLLIENLVIDVTSDLNLTLLVTKITSLT